MRRLILTSLLLLTVVANADSKFVGPLKPQIKIAVIDTGIDESLMTSDSLCKQGHKDFTNTSLKDTHGHGTHISGIIDQYAKNYILDFKKESAKLDKISANYCQIIIKYYDTHAVFSDNLENTIKAFQWAIDQKVDIINYSGGGTSFSKEEKAVVEKALNAGIKIVAAAGNEASNLEVAKYYPAMYDSRIYVVGNLVDAKSNKIAKSSNYGKPVNTWEIGTNILSRLPNKSYGLMTGTSQATAIKSGKLVREMMGYIGN